MKPPSCPICDYSLIGVAPEVDCPECGASIGQRLDASHCRKLARRFTWVYILMMAPSWGSLLCLVLGWSIAHLFIGIPNPHWVQTGEYPALDVLGGLAVLLLAGSLISIPAAVCVLPIALVLQSRVRTVSVAHQWQAYAFLVILAAPSVLQIAMMRPFGGQPWGLVDWRPD